MRLHAFIVLVNQALAYDLDKLNLIVDYFDFKNVKFLCYFSCYGKFDNIMIGRSLMQTNMRVSKQRIDKDKNVDIDSVLRQWNSNVGVLVHGDCYGFKTILDKASGSKLFDAAHMWLVFGTNDRGFIKDNFKDIDLSVDADVAIVTGIEGSYKLTDVYNFGKTQGNPLESSPLGTWRRDKGLLISNGFKYYRRWNFHNLTLRAVSVILDRSEAFYPELLSDIKYIPGVAAMTKIASRLLNILKEEHNFRFNYTIASRWIGSPERNSTLAVSNSLYWGEQDISSTTARIFPQWLDWVDIYYPPVTNLETKFYYIISDKGVGKYENRFLTPMSPEVWWSSLVTGLVCAVVLATAALMERRPNPGLYAFFSVFATSCQQDFEDGVQISEAESSQGRRGTLLVVGLTSMLLYNYYTSSVVSWLLNAAAPSIANIDNLINSDLELIFEDIGYTRGWLDNPGFFYYSGFVNAKEDELRERKVITAKRKLEPLQSVETGIELIRSGRYAYHTEPFTASQVISRRFEEQELCELEALPMMLPAQVYIYGQKRSPYKQFFVWSLMRLLERGHTRASQARFAGTIPKCSGRMPSALALGQAAPAFILLVEAALLSTFILLVERIWSRYQNKKRAFSRAQDVGTEEK